ncbi:hypothetical protein [Actinomadura vinacea]|uniref:hypothetical protein n=1 Tax=Actinomadura vinacea TaxID=115336 RepID=UPI0031E14967
MRVETVLSTGRASRLVTRREVDPVHGCAPGSLRTLMPQQRGPLTRAGGVLAA